MTLKKKALENIVGKGENAGNQHFLLFIQFLYLNIALQTSFQTVFVLIALKTFFLNFIYCMTNFNF